MSELFLVFSILFFCSFKSGEGGAKNSDYSIKTRADKEIAAIIFFISIKLFFLL